VSHREHELGQQNKALARSFTQHLSKKEIPEAAKMLAPDFRYRAPGFPELSGPKEWQTLMSFFAANSPRLQFNVEEQIAEGNTVVTRYTWHTVHEREFMGMAPTGKHLTLASIALHRVRDGKITEEFVLDDYLGLFRQIGAIPIALVQHQMEVAGGELGVRAVPVGEAV